MPAHSMIFLICSTTAATANESKNDQLPIVTTTTTNFRMDPPKSLKHPEICNDDPVVSVLYTILLNVMVMLNVLRD